MFLILNYEDFVKTTDKSNHNLQFYIDGMNEENGEISGIFKRVRRGDYGDIAKHAIDDHARGMRWVLANFEDVFKDLIKEIGDRHWYTTRLLQEMGVSWLYVEKINLEKLDKRNKTGKILGHGDNRENEE